MILKTDFFAARGQLYLPMLPAQTETLKNKGVPHSLADVTTTATAHRNEMAS
jgi:hypothetical protein